ncbi:hypothetical protein G5V58_24035 [Nocardioides anomalus]|uniref:Uncharacterized protein n=1 Tax=Nocardioides anomalus TaxID=2712223 RepID=A0A6G6WK14_9ACTN|nr:hypothetical protein [Nocardioides anomalus]QIG45410.1 hypothetical protein G5V58_24035 [Nocardioides anomalus]
MRFTERELTVALQGAAKTVLAAQDKDVRKGRRTPDEAWEALGKFQRFQLLDGLGDQLLPVLVALPDVEVAPGTRPTFTEAQVRSTVEEHAGVAARGLKGRVLVQARVALVTAALEALPPRADPDALIVPDHL